MTVRIGPLSPSDSLGFPLVAQPPALPSRFDQFAAECSAVAVALQTNAVCSEEHHTANTMYDTRTEDDAASRLPLALQTQRSASARVPPATMAWTNFVHTLTQMDPRAAKQTAMWSEMGACNERRRRLVGSALVDANGGRVSLRRLVTSPRGLPAQRSTRHDHDNTLTAHSPDH